MKYLFLGLLVTLNVFASVTPAQMKAIRASAFDVMIQVGGEGELNAHVTKVKVIDELGSRVKVEFSYDEQMFGTRTCTYYFDLDFMKPVPRSALCNP